MPREQPVAARSSVTPVRVMRSWERGRPARNVLLAGETPALPGCSRRAYSRCSVTGSFSNGSSAGPEITSPLGLNREP